MESKAEGKNLNELNLGPKDWKVLTQRYQTAVKKNKNYRKAIRQLQGAYNSTGRLNDKLIIEVRNARLLVDEFRKQLNEQNNEIKRVMNLKYKKWWQLW